MQSQLLLIHMTVYRNYRVVGIRNLADLAGVADHFIHRRCLYGLESGRCLLAPGYILREIHEQRYCKQ